MTKPQSFVFHIPHTGNMLNYDELEKKMHHRNPPNVVQVIDPSKGKRLGSMPAGLALIKFR